MIRKLSILLLVFTGSVNLNFAQGTWSTVAAMPTGRQHLTSATYDGKIYVFGGEGISNNQMLTTLEMYDPGANSWSARAPMPGAIGFCNAATVGTKIYVIGGWNGRF